jgi:hypothetical protein
MDFEPFAGDRQVQYPFLGADRTIALADRALSEIDVNPEAHATAMTAALIGAEHAFLHRVRRNCSMGLA